MNVEQRITGGQGTLTVLVTDAPYTSARQVIQFIRQFSAGIAQENRRLIALFVRVDMGPNLPRRWVSVQMGNAFMFDPNGLAARIATLIGQDGNEPGSTSFVTEEDFDPQPDWTTFSIKFSPRNAGFRVYGVDRLQNAAQRGNLRVYTRSLNPSRALRGDRAVATTRKGKKPLGWVFQAKDHSHVAFLPTSASRGDCVNKVFSGLGVVQPAQETNMDTMGMEELIDFIATHIRNQLHKDVMFVHGWKESNIFLRDATQFHQDSKAPPQVRGPAGDEDSVYERLLVGMLKPIPDDTVVILWDGEGHVALPVLTHTNEGVFLTPHRNVLLKGSRLFFLYHPKETARKAPPSAPITVGKRGDSIPFRVGTGWRLERIDSIPQPLEMEVQTSKGYLFFDFETVAGTDQILRPYSVSYLIVPVDENTLLPLAGPLSQPHVPEYFKREAVCYTGEDAATFLAKLIIRLSYATRDDPNFFTELVGVSFNGSRFDHFLLYKALLDMAKETRASTGDKWEFTKDPFWMGTSLVSFTVNDFFSVFDLARHLIGSLDSNCKAFGTVNQKTSDGLPEHETIQHVFETECAFHIPTLLNHTSASLIPRSKTLQDYPGGLPSFRSLLVSYNNDDVSSLAELFFRYRSNNLVVGPKSNLLCPPITLASESFQSWSEYIKEKYSIPGCDLLRMWAPLDYTLYKDIRSTSVAGRTQCFHPPQRIDETCVSMDVTSLYPYVMAIAPVEYPCGKHVLTPVSMSEEEFAVNFHKISRLGLFRCHVDQTYPMSVLGLPAIIARKMGSSPDAPGAPRNDWHSPVVPYVWLTTPEVKTLLKYNAKVSCSAMILWDAKIRSIDLFGSLASLMHSKNEEDTKKANKDPTYNAARRQAAKLASNALYGKMMEDYHCDKRVELDYDDWMEIMNDVHFMGKREKYLSCTVVHSLSSSDIVADVKENPDQPKYRFRQRPIVVGMYILAYARMYMYEHTYSVLKQKHCIYTDTDAIKCTASAFNTILRPYLEATEVPHWPEAEQFDPLFAGHPMYKEGSKVYGAFENELDGKLADNSGLYVIAKKVWACVPKDPLDVSMWKLAGKAITMRDIILTKEQVTALYQLRSSSARQYYLYAQNLYANKQNSVKNSPARFYDSLLYNQEAYVLKSDLRKNTTQLKQNVRWDGENEPEGTVENYSTLSQIYRVIVLRPVENQEVPYDDVVRKPEPEPFVIDSLSAEELRTELFSYEAGELSFTHLPLE